MTKHKKPTQLELDIELLDDKALDEVAKELPLIALWMGAVTTELERRIAAGSVFQYAAMRDKRPQSKWADGIDIIEILTNHLPLEQAAPRVPLTPSKAKEVLGDVTFERLAQYVRRESSGQTLGFTHPGKTPFTTEN